ncbi:hypothetical protein J6590_079169 [Homalodisca vitripennis]|nr:hypothetical protein J6590_079169 [Homalodisca vitripennis]
MLKTDLYVFYTSGCGVLFNQIYPLPPKRSPSYATGPVLVVSMRRAFSSIMKGTQYQKYNGAEISDVIFLSVLSLVPDLVVPERVLCGFRLAFSAACGNRDYSSHASMCS